MRDKERVIRAIQKYEESDPKLEDKVFIKELKEAINIEKRLARRRKNVSSLFPLIFGLLTMAVIYFYSFTGQLNQKEMVFSNAITFIVAIVTSGMIFLWRYLQGDFIAEKFDNPGSVELVTQPETLDLEIFVNEFVYKYEILKDSIAILDERITESLSKNAVITDEQKQEYIEIIKNRLKSEASVDFLKDLESRANKKAVQETFLPHLDKQFGQSFDRLNKEIGALGRRGNLNLLLGIITTIIGLAVLGFFVSKIPSEVRVRAQPLSQSSIDALNENLPLQAKREILKLFEEKTFTSDDTYKFIIGSFMPRLSLVILIELFAYFFLKPYKSSLSEIKYFQNELSNFEAKYISLRMAIIDKDKGVFNEVVKTLSRTERNYIY